MNRHLHDEYKASDVAGGDGRKYPGFSRLVIDLKHFMHKSFESFHIS